MTPYRTDPRADEIAADTEAKWRPIAGFARRRLVRRAASVAAVFGIALAVCGLVALSPSKVDGASLVAAIVGSQVGFVGLVMIVANAISRGRADDRRVLAVHFARSDLRRPDAMLHSELARAEGRDRAGAVGLPLGAMFSVIAGVVLAGGDTRLVTLVVPLLVYGACALNLIRPDADRFTSGVVLVLFSPIFALVCWAFGMWSSLLIFAVFGIPILTRLFVAPAMGREQEAIAALRADLYASSDRPVVEDTRESTRASESRSDPSDSAIVGWPVRRTASGTLSHGPSRGRDRSPRGALVDGGLVD